MSFRFVITAPPLRLPISEWADDVRRLEDLGFFEVVVADHFTDGYDTEPMVALTAAAMATTRLRVRPSVLGVDYRHPVLVHRMAATLDVVSQGRLGIGMGSGWLTSDYRAAGISLDSPGERVSIDPQLVLGTLLVETNVPNTDACNIGGDSWQYQFTYDSGQYISTSPGNVVGTKLSNAITVGVVVVRLPSGQLKAIATDAAGTKTPFGVNIGGSAASGKRTGWRELTQ